MPGPPIQAGRVRSVINDHCAQEHAIHSLKEFGVALTVEAELLVCEVKLLKESFLKEGS